MKEETLVKENLEYLKQFEDRFHTAVYSQYARAITTKDFNQLRDILVQMGYNTTNNANCAKCQYNLLLQLGKIYYEQTTKATENTPDAKGGDVEEPNKATSKGKRSNKR